MNTVTVIGAGLAGCEAAHQLAKRGIQVRLYEMKPKKMSPAHHYPGFAELVCSNSLKADRLGSAAGMLKAEMRLFDSVVLEAADRFSVPGGALAVERTAFFRLYYPKITADKNIEVTSQKVSEIPQGNVIVATGPLTADDLAENIRQICGTETLSFLRCSCSIVTADSIDMSVAFIMASRYDKGDADYINCPMNKEEYERFYQALIAAEIAPLKSLIKNIFGCMKDVCRSRLWQNGARIPCGSDR